MRLWHIDLIPYLPKSQLLAQWRELNSIFKKQDKHILINYVYDYDKYYLYCYTIKVLEEIGNRHYNYNLVNFCEYFDYVWYKELYEMKHFLKFAEHNKEYLTICYWNLREKYIRGQKDFTKEVWNKLDIFYKNHF